MNTTHTLATATLALAALLGTTGCSNMSRHDQNTAVGAGVGAVAGSVLTGGNPIGTVGGAVVGGVIGSEVDKRR